MRRKLSSIFLVLVFLSTLAFEAYPQIYQVFFDPRSTGSTCSLVVNFDFSSPSIAMTFNRYSVTMPGLPSYGNPGEPILPFRLTRILVPQCNDVKNISVYPGNMVRLTGRFNIDYGKTPLPLSANMIVQDKPSEAIYNSAQPFPSQLYSLESEQLLRGYKILVIRLYPVTYIPKTGELYFYTKLTLNVELEETGEVSPYFRKLQGDAELVRSLVENPYETTTYATVAADSSGRVSATVVTPSLTQSYDYVIITSNALNSSFQPLVNWKIRKGLSAKIVFIEDIMKDPKYNSNGMFGDGTGNLKFNDTQAHVRNFIKNAYVGWGTEYVLLGGDDEIIPVRGIYDYAGNYTDYSIPCDMYYGALDGSWNTDNDTAFGEAVYHWSGPENASAGEEADFFAEVYIGRATVDTPQEAMNFVNKIIAYEQSPDADYLNKVLMVGEALDDVTQGANGEDTITDIVPQYTTTRLYARDGTYITAVLKSELNSGAHIVNHNGHSNYRRIMNLSASDIDALENNQFFLVYSVGCYSAAFDAAVSGTIESVAEHFLSGSQGAFAYIGNTRYGWYCPASHDGPGETYDKSFFSVLNSGVTNLGKALQLSKEREPLFDRWTYFTLNLLGDPETEIVTSLKNPTAHFKTNTDLLSPPHVGGIVTLTGTARLGTSPEAVFSNYIIEFGNGTNPTSWMTTAIDLTEDGQIEIINDSLATWDTGQITDGTYTVKLTVNGGGLQGTDRWVVIVNKHATPFYIKADGTIDPATAPVRRNGDTYTLTNDILCDGDGIVIQRDNIILNGADHTLQGTGSGKGIYLFERINVTINNIWVRSKLYGIYLEHSSNNTISRCTTENGTFGIWLLDSTRNTIAANKITNNYYGISLLLFSNNNTIIENQVANNTGASNSTGAYAAGIYLYVSSNNSFYHNIFAGNAIQRNSQVYDAAWDCPDPGVTAPSINIWDDGYPSGGNYWSNYDRTDLYKGVYQNETGADGIGDRPYIVDANETTALDNTDRYPLIDQLAHDIAIMNLTTSKTAVGTGSNITIKAWVKNEGRVSETFNVTIGVTSITYESIDTFENVTLANEETTILSCTWNTIDWPLCNYTVSAYAFPVQNEVATVDNSFTSAVVSISVLGDITGRSGVPDGKVDMYDVSSVARLFGSRYPDPNYDPNFDTNDDGRLDMFDLGTVARHFGEHT